MDRFVQVLDCTPGSRRVSQERSYNRPRLAALRALKAGPKDRADPQSSESTVMRPSNVSRTRIEPFARNRVRDAVRRRSRRNDPESRGDGFKGWARWIEQDEALWRSARERAADGPSVLLATSMGGFAPATVLEGLLGVALTLRGASVRFLLCDKALPACLQTHDLPPDPDLLARLETVLCEGCYARGAATYATHGLPVWRFGEFLSEHERTHARALANSVPYGEIAGYRWEDLAVGEHALAGALRFYARGQLAGADRAETTLRRYLEASLLAATVMRNLIRQERVDRACFHHGIYVPQGLIAEACRQASVPIVTWNVAYRKGCFLFSHEDTYHHTMLTEPVGAWEDMDWGAAQEREVMGYLDSRLTGTRDWIWFHEKPVEDVRRIAAELGLDLDRPTVGLLTNVFWDAQLHYPSNAFRDMLDWVLKTVAYFERRPELQLLIRIHPAEIRGNIPSRQPLLPEIQRAFPDLPANVFVIPAESNSSTYAAMDICDAVLIYGTKTGVELSSRGIPVVVAGEAWVRGKGITLDASSEVEYFRILDGLPLGHRLDEDTVRRARMYAYHFFYRRMIPLPFVAPAGGGRLSFSLEIDGLDDLMPGRHPGLDVICDGILMGTPFVYHAELAVA